MFTLLSGLWKYLFQKDEYCILILGLDNAGKSTLLEQIKRIYGNNYSGLAFEKIKATIGLNIVKITMNHVKLIIWDFGGQQELRSFWDKYYEECHGVICVIDSSDGRRLAESQKMLCMILRWREPLILANKQDLQAFSKKKVTDRKDWLSRAMEERKWRRQQGLPEAG